MICTENQMTGFYMKCNIGLKWAKGSSVRKKNAVKIDKVKFFHNDVSFLGRISIHSILEHRETSYVFGLILDLFVANVPILYSLK